MSVHQEVGLSRQRSLHHFPDLFLVVLSDAKHLAELTDPVGREVQHPLEEQVVRLHNHLILRLFFICFFDLDVDDIDHWGVSPPSEFTDDVRFNLSEVVAEDSGHLGVELEEPIQDSPVVKRVQIDSRQNVFELHLLDVSYEKNDFDGAREDGLEELFLAKDLGEVSDLGDPLLLDQQLIQDPEGEEVRLLPIQIHQPIERLLVRSPVPLLCDQLVQDHLQTPLERP
eukprot:CAMPEP_0170547390 /NCGR_PEP_ID=MMETSP0211-20121228/5779_1 /TAXON_ID=311385 /ORGANISM="Pseudokeronopsis sp., Strain OXSARD2" /LENGTH=226 /DNA_ID=CAMNT_0010852409 /DNA_START=886 /DNA_END=1566 /DNA_ORIENTATION=-